VNASTPDSAPRAGFTLIELLVTVALFALLATLAAGGITGSLHRARTLQCMGTMRTLGQGIHLYASENRNRFPRSLHSAGAHGQPQWAHALLPFLGENPDIQDLDHWQDITQRLFRCPMDRSTDPMTLSYGLNVFFELDPAGDSYEGSPRQWRTLLSIPNPAATVMLAEVPPVPFGDHVMAHLWNSPAAVRHAIAHDRHRSRSHYVFVDGSVHSLAAEQTFDPARGINRWNPALAQ
jgi:prepilin-type N-terminal cleavage/methylation domain-containing protein/prepilin-type processing-associated H-X9-DG protein